MNVTLRLNILIMVGIITLSSLLGCVVLIYNARDMGKSLRLETEKHIQALIGKNAESIESSMLIMEKNAEDLAVAGETFLAICRDTGRNITPQMKEFLLRNFELLPEAIGGGLWYEPYTIQKDKKYFGPYVYRKDGRVNFTWDLNTPEYDYLSQNWYVLALPENWDRLQKRPERIYWTDPYVDEAATQALMITVDALMMGRENRTVGLATVDFSLENLKKMVYKMKVTPGSLPFAVDLSSDLLISFPADPSKVMKKMKNQEWGGKVLDLKDRVPGLIFIEKIVLKEKKYSLFATVTKTGTGLGILAPDDELYANINRLDRFNVIISFIVISFQVLLYVLISLFMVRRISSPIAQLTEVAQKIAAGDIGGASGSLSTIERKIGVRKDETGRLLHAFAEMSRSLNALFGQVQQSGNQITSSSAQIAASSRQLETTMSEQAASTRQASVSSKQISETAGNLVETMSGVSHAASETAKLAESGQKGLETMETSMQAVLGGTDSVSGKLAGISENASRISTIVTTITKVADQTNLLSLNAAIEAEKAGEYGRGFSVVANEIRRLADQTSVAVLDIEEIVNKMELSVTEGAEEMEIFTREVRSGVDKISRFGKQLEGIMDKVQTLRPGFETVNAAMETQSENASQISETMEQLTITTHDTLESLREFNLATDYLKEAATGLQDEVSRFKVTT